MSRSRRSAEGFEWAYRDVLIALLVVFMAMAALAIVSIANHAVHAGVRQGQIVVTMQWQKDKNADVDLWVEAPGDAPVGFAHSGDHDCNLLRDDLGKQSDSESRNEEFVMCRAALPGEWIVNVMMYNEYDHKFPTSVVVVVSRLTPKGTSILLKRTVELVHNGEQFTIARFTLDKRGHLIPGSINQVPEQLYDGSGMMG